MHGKTHYKNGQKAYELDNNTLRYSYADGRLRAEGGYENDMMQGDWTFYRQSGQL